MSEITEITLNLPGPHEKGFLRRIREVKRMMDESAGGVESWLALGDYLVEHGMVSVPAGIDPREAIEELTHADMQRAARLLLGNYDDEPKTVNPPNGAA